MQAYYIRAMLEKSIGWVAEHIHHYVEKEGHFSRRRKLTVDMLLIYLLTAGARSAVTELQKLFKGFSSTPCGSALCMQLAKLKPEAVREMFFLFNEALYGRGGRPPKWRFIAADGTHFSFANRHRNDPKYDEWHHTSGKKHMEGEVTALYDMRQMRFIDAVMQPLRKISEYAALCQMIDRLKDYGTSKTCITADRGFPSWNVLAHTVKRTFSFLMRAKDVDSGTSMLKSLKSVLPDTDEYDQQVNVRLIRNSKIDAVTGWTDILLDKRIVFDYLDHGDSGEFRLSFRVIRYTLDSGEPAVILTNLPYDEFGTRKILQLYRERWCIETAFGQLKGALAMESFHTNRPELIEQEIWAKLTAFNYVSAIRHAANRRADIRTKQLAKPPRHKYEVDFTFACTAALGFLNSTSPYYEEPDLIDVVSRKRHAVKRIRNNPSRGSTQRRTPLPVTHRCAL